MKHKLCTKVSCSMIYSIIREELNLCKVCVRWVPWQLSVNNKTACLKAVLNWWTWYHNKGKPMLHHIITGNETWVHHFTPLTKRQSMVWKRSDEPSPIKFKTTVSANKVLCAVFWYSWGTIHKEYLKYGETVTVDCYFDTLLKDHQS